MPATAADREMVLRAFGETKAAKGVLGFKPLSADQPSSTGQPKQIQRGGGDPQPLIGNTMGSAAKAAAAKQDAKSKEKEKETKPEVVDLASASDTPPKKAPEKKPEKDSENEVEYEKKAIASAGELLKRLGPALSRAGRYALRAGAVGGGIGGVHGLLRGRDEGQSRIGSILQGIMRGGTIGAGIGGGAGLASGMMTPSGLHKALETLRGTPGRLEYITGRGTMARPSKAVLAAAREAEKKAKNRYGRNALCVSILKRSGEPVVVGSHWETNGRRVVALVKNAIEDFAQERLASRFVYELSDQMQSLGKVETSMLQSLLKHLLKRHHNQKKPLPETKLDTLMAWVEAFEQGEAVEGGAAGELSRWLFLARFITQGGGE